MNNRNTTMTTKLYMLYSTRIFTSCMVGLWKLYPWNVPCNKQKRFSLPEAKARSDKRMTIWAFYIYIFHIWFGPFPSQTKCNFQATWKNLIQSIWEKSHHFKICLPEMGAPFTVSKFASLIASVNVWHQFSPSMVQCKFARLSVTGIKGREGCWKMSSIPSACSFLLFKELCLLAMINVDASA